MLDPAKFYDRWLHRDEWTFKKDLIAFAGDDFATNERLVENKWIVSVVITILFFLEAAFLAV